MLAALIGREIRLALRHGADSVAAVLFFLVVSVLSPLAISPSPAVLARLAGGIVWVAALLASLLPLERLFGADYDDGSLDQLLLSGLSPLAVAAGKTAAHWLLTGLPLLVAAGPIAIMLRLDPGRVAVLLEGLLPGTLTLSLIGAAGAALVLGARRGAMLLPLLVLPLATPVLIFGTAAVAQDHPRAELLLLAALLAAALPLCPLAAGAGLKAAAGS